MLHTVIGRLDSMDGPNEKEVTFKGKDGSEVKQKRLLTTGMFDCPMGLTKFSAWGAEAQKLGDLLEAGKTYRLKHVGILNGQDVQYSPSGKAIVFKKMTLVEEVDSDTVNLTPLPIHEKDIHMAGDIDPATVAKRINMAGVIVEIGDEDETPDGRKKRCAIQLE